MTFQSYQSLTQYTSLGNAEIRTPVGSNRSNEEPSVLGCSTGPGYKARPFLTEQKSFEINEKNPAYHPGPVPPPSGAAPFIGPILLVMVVSSISRIHKHEFHLKCTGIEHIVGANLLCNLATDATISEQFRRRRIRRKFEARRSSKLIELLKPLPPTPTTPNMCDVSGLNLSTRFKKQFQIIVDAVAVVVVVVAATAAATAAAAAVVNELGSVARCQLFDE